MRLIIFFSISSIMLGLFISCGNGESAETSANSLSASGDTGRLLASVKKYPDSLMLKENLIQTFRELNQYPRAISWANFFLKADSTNARLWEILSVLEFESGDTTAAIRAMEKRAFFSTDLEGMQKLSTLYAVSGNPQTDEALDWLRKNGDPKQEADRIFTEGLYRSSLQDWTGALQAYERCLNLDPHILDGYIEKAYVLCQLGKQQEAIQCLEKGTVLHNNFPEGYLELGYLYQESKQLEKARACFQKALLYNPDFAEATEALAQLPQP
ncbi:MAG: tetratricopeptide repeat protein [Ferruginibacter sp.]